MSKTIIINEEMAGKLKDLLTMTQFKFKANIKKFLASLLEDPTGAEPDMIFTQNGLDKNKLIKALVDNKVIGKKMTIDDHDENGNPHTAKMIVKYSVPKERFNEKLDALYDVLFPNAETKINEEYDPYQDALRIAKASPLTMGVVSGGVNARLSPDYGMGKFFDDAAKGINSKLGQKTTRNSCAGYIYCKDDSGEWCILAGKRGSTSPTGAGQFNPPMGMIEDGENIKTCISRECLEETGINIDPNKFKIAGTENWGQFKENVGYNLYCYLDGVTNEYTIGNGDGENEKFIWIPISKISGYNWAFTTGEQAVKLAPKEQQMNEEGGGAASCSGVDGNGFGSGEFVQPLFGGISVRKKKKDKNNVGGNPYTLTEAVTGEDGRKSSAVYAYAKNNNGEWCILAAKRNKKWDDEGGKMNPPMGHRHKYESAEDGAVRECEEESGIKFDKKDLVLASKEDWGTNFKIYLPGKTSDYKPGEGDEENTKFKWIPVSEIDNYEWAWSCGTFAKRFKPKK